MGAPAVVEVGIPTDAGSRFADRVVGSEVDLFVLDAPPQPLDDTLSIQCPSRPC